MSDEPTSHPPAFYFPPRGGRYEVAPGLLRFGKELGNGPADAQVFQIDSDFDAYRREKLATRREGVARYFCTSDFSAEAEAAVTAFAAQRLASEHPRWFALRGPDGRNLITLTCALTREVLTFDARMGLVASEGTTPADPPYASALDALACQVQEDIAVVSGKGGRHWLSAAHVCFPNGWSPREKIGRDFAGLHEPVAGMEAMNRRGGEFANVMFGATDGLVRFAWGIAFDDELNHHPDAPRVAFRSGSPQAFLRVERQTVWGLPHTGASLFTIRTYLYDCRTLCRDPAARAQLVSAVASMTSESAAYKNLSDARSALVRWLSEM